MSIFLTTLTMALAVILIVMIGMAISVFAGRGPIAGSCGGDSVVRNCPACKETVFKNGDTQ